MDEEPIETVDSVGALDPVAALLREFLHRSGAERVAAVIAGDPQPAFVDCSQLAPIEVVTADERTVHLHHGAELRLGDMTVPDVRQLPPFEVRADDGEIAAPLGGLEHYAIAVRALADTLGERDVALATFTTTDPEAPLSITARRGDPLVLTIGEQSYEMDAGWPVDPAAAQ